MQINFIPDEVLKLNKENDLLGTKPYSDTIFEIVNNCDGKKNIGLFGTWGSGKSSILSTLEDLIEEQNLKIEEKENGKKIAYFEFDSWKYSKDDFRRSFLIELNKKFKIKSQEKLLKLLYSETSVEDPELTKTKFNWFSLPNWIIFAIAFASVFFYFSPLLADSNYLKGSVSLFVLLISLLVTAANNTISKYKVVVKQNKIIEPERFETIFDEIISEITTKSDSSNIVYKWIEKLKNKPKYSKVVIIIDNLDRCDDENLLVTLNTVKNFLEHKKVVFVLPVDEKGISAFLSQKTDNADEYLRKIFHLIIRLKEFSKKELFEFTNKINEAYSLGLNASSIRIICYEFTSNPRKVIQFLNNYQSEMKLVEEQSRLGYINGEFIRNNLSFFIKLLIIKYEWRILYDEILEDKNLLNKINDVITNLEPDDEGLYLINRTNVKLNDSQRNFFFSTQEFHCSKIDHFVRNIDLDKDIPDEIEEFIRNGNYDRIVNYLNNDELGFNEYRLLQKMDEVYSNLTFKHREYSFIALPVLKLMIQFVLDDKQEDFRKIIKDNHNEYSFLKSLFTDKKLHSLFDKFEFERLVKTVKWFSDNITDDFFESFVDFLNKTLFNSSNQIDNEYSKIDFFLKTFKGSNKLNKIREQLGNKLVSEPNLLDMEALKDYELASKIISASNYKKMSKKLNDDNEEGALVKYKIEKICMPYAISNPKDKTTKTHLIKYFLNDIESLYETNQISESVYVEYKGIFINLNILLTYNVDVELSDSFIDVLTKINNYLYNLYNANFPESELYDIYELFFELVKNLIFFTKEFNSISSRTTFFGNYLKKNFSKKISLKLNDILYQDVDKHDVFDYPFSDTLIKLYEDPENPSLPYGETLILMLEKSVDNEDGLSKSQIKSIILRTINVFSKNYNQKSVVLMKKLKESAGEQLLEILNNNTGIYTDYYVESVKLLEDDWFYGDSILNYLKEPLYSPKEGAYSTFKGRLGNLVKIFSIEEQIKFIQQLIDNSNNKVYKWLRLSFNILPKKVYDIYLENLIFGHENDMVGNNNFFEWIIEIPKEIFYRNRLRQYSSYLESLDIQHKTYKPKKEKAFNHLVGK